MANHRFYCDMQLGISNTIDLPAPVSSHIVKVLRLTSGSPVILFNGDGNDYEAELIIQGKKASATVTAQLVNRARSPINTHLGQALSRSDRMDYSIQKSVEMGINAITPLITERVQFRMDAKRIEKKRQHWQGIIISACEQCGRSDIPELHPVMKLEEWLSSSAEKTLLLDPTAPRSLSECLDQDYSGSDEVRLVIGPEGGFSDAELATADPYIHRATIGPRILRTETAATAVLAIIQNKLGDF